VHAIAVSYLRIAAPVFGLFCGGYTLYFASQGTGNMIIPVSITWVRLLVVAGIGFAAAIFDWGLDTVFVGVAVGLVVVAAGHVLNVLKGPGWRYD
jgi:Na+-driven multidrug efflux pump